MTIETLAPATVHEPSTIIPRITRRLIPFLILLFVVNYLDRTNVAMAKLQMLGDTHINEAVYGLGAGLFFIGYFLFEVPSNMILERVGARRWIARIMITWGIICSAMMFVRGAHSFYWLRFLLGAAEAGFFPGIILYLTYWIPSRHRASVMAAFLTSTAISGIIGNPLAGILMKMDGILNLHGWQWLFLLEGLLPVGLGVVTWILLPDRPIHAKWLSEDDRAWIEQELDRERETGGSAAGHHVAELTDALKDTRLWLLSVIYFLLIMGLYGFIYWLPTIVKTATHTTDLEVGFLCAIPNVIATIAMILVARHADRHDERRKHVAACAIVAALGVTVVAQVHAPIPTLLALSLAAIGIFSSLGPFWALSTRFLRSRAAAGGIAIVNSIGALAGFVSPSVIGYAKNKTGSVSAGLYVVAASLIAGAIAVMLIPKAVDSTER
jgi:D-galactonate transporter